jgi:hypothetical protein
VGLNSLKSLNLTNVYPNNNNKNKKKKKKKKKNKNKNKNKKKNKVKSKPLELRSRVKSRLVLVCYGLRYQSKARQPRCFRQPILRGNWYLKMTIGILKLFYLKLRKATHCAIMQPCKHKVITQPSSKNIAHATFAARVDYLR